MLTGQRDYSGKDYQGLVRLFKKGDHQAFTKIFEMFHGPLLYFTRQIIRDMADAEDITANTFIKLYHRRAAFNNLQHIKSFLFTAARNACLNSLRDRRTHMASHREIHYLSKEETDMIDRSHISALVLTELKCQIETLPKECRKICELIFYKGKNTEEIATELGITKKTVLNQKNTAIRHLRAALLKKHLLPAILFIILKLF